MTIVQPCTPDDYGFSFWTRQCRKEPYRIFPPTAGARKGIILREWPYKFPTRAGKEFMWQICRIETQEALESLWIHKDGNWLNQHGLWKGSHTYGVTLLGKKLPREKLGALARSAIDTDFFRLHRYPKTAQYQNYHRWKDNSLEGVLAGHEKPMLVQREEYIDILDGFGRLLAYLALVLQGSPFLPFEAYFVS